jgi:transposase
MLKSGTLYQDLGANHFNHRAKNKSSPSPHHLIHRLKNLGFNVQITPSAA